jgi:CHAT domain-containing protein
VLGTYDHPMTDVALLELGKLAFEQGHYDSAKNYFLESTFAAAQFGHATIIQEGFRGALITHLVSGKPGVLPELTRAHPFARSQGFRHLEVLLRIMAAESYAFTGQTPQALAFLDEARVRMGRRDMAAGATGAYFNYQLALAHFQKGDLKTGTAALGQSMAYQKKGSRWLLQIAIADKLYTSGAVSPRVGKMLYDTVLREPTAADWSVDPMETLSVVLTPREIPMEHWFLLTLLQRKEHEEALEIADRVRRQRFYSSLPLGGRLLALRWILEAPKEALRKAALLQREDLLVKYPKYADSSRAAAAIRDELRKLPAVPVDEHKIRQQADLLTKLAAETAAQELLLRAIALRRDPSEFVFPPLKKTAEIKESLTDRQLALAFFATTRAVYAFIFTRDKYNFWQVESPTKIRQQVIEMLKGMGHYSRDRTFTAEDLADQSWKEPAAEVLSLLLNRHKGDFWGKYDELIVVPDGALWYVPFEALQVPTATGKTVPLVSKIRIRLAPTASLITPDRRNWKPAGTTAVVVGKMVPRADQAFAREAFDELRLVDPSSVAITEKLPAPSSLVKTLWDRLVVLDDVDDATRAPYDWTPAQIDLGKFGSTLGTWLQLPWGGPEQVILPGFHSVAEEGLKRSHGQEIFLTVCGMMATGARTVLMSRWRVGGQTDFDLVREFLQEIPHVEASAAWRRSVALARANPVDPTREPRLKLNLVEEPPKATHPLFWAGYLLADTGSDPAAKSADDAAPDAAAAAAAGP